MNEVVYLISPEGAVRKKAHRLKSLEVVFGGPAKIKVLEVFFARHIETQSRGDFCNVTPKFYPLLKSCNIKSAFGCLSERLKSD